MTDVFRGIRVVAYRELLRFVQERSRLISSFIMPLIFLVIFGAGFGQTIGSLVPGVNYLQFMYPGIIAMTVVMGAIMSGISIVWDREFGFLKELLVSPIGRSGILLGKSVGAATTAILQTCIMLILAPILGIPLSFILIIELLIAIFIISVSISGLGLLVASRMKSQQGFQLVTQIIIMPLIFLAGVFFPVNNVPAWMEFISKINPLTYGVDAIRQIFLGSEAASALSVSIFGHTMSIFEDILVVVVFGGILMVAAIWSFSKQE
ncbi:MAG: ABC transporter permease [Dehalococcoidales bacterium]|nr:ABC transporter permease [Dehalococcoidales bacterium]